MAKARPREIALNGSPTRALAEFVAGLSYKNIPTEVVSHIKFCLLDSLGCALFGSTLPWGKIITSFTKELGKGKGALITGGSRGLGKAMARGFAEAGANLMVTSRHEDELRPMSCALPSSLSSAICARRRGSSSPPP